MFVSWCANQAGISEEIIPCMASTVGNLKWFKERGRYHSKNSKKWKYNGQSDYSDIDYSYIPSKGDIVLFETNNNFSDGPDHTALVTSVEENGVIHTVEGNVSGNKVLQFSYLPNNSKIWGYCSPDYKGRNWFDDLVPLDLGNDFYAYIINTFAWKHLTNTNNNVIMSDETGDNNQIWRFIKQNDNSYVIINVNDGKLLDCNNAGITDGTNVSTVNENGSLAQKWFVYGESGSYYLRAACGELALDITGASTISGTNVQMWSKNESVAQKFQIWKLNKVSTTKLTCEPGSNICKTIISWDKVEGATSYDLKIWKGKLWEGEAYKIIWGLTENSCEVDLPEGYYEAYIDVRNNYSLS